MPTVKDLSPHVTTACEEIKRLPGVTAVYLFGSYANNLDKPNYVVKDVDVIAATKFDSGDLLAIDNSRYSALRISPLDLEDEGFNPEAVTFTKRFLGYEKYNVDHWAASSDGVLLHWGVIADSRDEWQELHEKAEKKAETLTGLKRAELRTKDLEARKDWKRAYDQYISKFLETSTTGWYPSDHSVDDIISKAQKI